MNIDRETLAIVIDIFEDFLEEKGIRIPNSERDSQYGDGENGANIYGEDFDNLMDKLQELFKSCGINVPNVYDNEVTSPEPVTDLVIYIPAYDDIICIDEGTGDNLLKEDVEEGIVDYLQYYVYDAEDIGTIDSEDGGMLTSKEYIRDKYKSMRDAVPEVLRMVYDNDQLTWVVISGGTDFEEVKKNPDPRKLYRVLWFYGYRHYCYVKANSKEEAESIVAEKLSKSVKIAEVVEAKEHQIASQYDICLNFRNPRLDEDRLCG